MTITSMQLLLAILSDGDPAIRRRAVVDDIDDQVYQEILVSGDIELIVAGVQNKNVPHWYLSKAAEHGDEDVRAEVASKRRIDENVQLVLASDVSATVKARLVHNRSATQAVLDILSKDNDEFVKSAYQLRTSC